MSASWFIRIDKCQLWVAEAQADNARINLIQVADRLRSASQCLKCSQQKTFTQS